MPRHAFENSALFNQAATNFPIMEHLSRYLNLQSKLDGARIGWNCHLTELTALAVAVLVESGCRLFMSECNPETSDATSIDYMRELGAVIFTGPDRFSQLLEEYPSVISDTGFDLIDYYLSLGKDAPNTVLGANEITTSGITRMRELTRLPFPVININDSSIKSGIENFHGVGEGVVEALKILASNWSVSSRVTVVGYGQVGRGVSYHLRQASLPVVVVELDPVKALMAHYDGFPLSTLDEVLPETDILITCTGVKDLVPEELWREAKDGLYIINAGHWSEEVSASRLREMARSVSAVGEHVERLEMKSSIGPVKSLYLACGGNPANVVLLTGSIEPTLLHLSTEILSMEFILRDGWRLPKGEHPVPADIERAVAKLALLALGHRRD